jgi:hypothetical protein
MRATRTEGLDRVMSGTGLGRNLRTRSGRTPHVPSLQRGRAGRGAWAVASCLFFVLGGIAAGAQDVPIQTKFRVKYVASGAVYLEAGREAGLTEGQRLTVRREGTDDAGKEIRETAEIRIISVASASAAAEILSSELEVRPGDIASLSAEDVEKLKLQHASRESRKYPQVVTFTEGDPLDEEVRDYIQRPPLPEVNRFRGRIGFEYNSLRETGSGGLSSSQLGFVLRGDMTRIGGSYWNLSGYYRGRFTSRTGSDEQTLTDLINRTYHISLTYNNPGSRWVAGFGRLYLPWANSLNTIDGGYLGRRYGKTTFGLFGGTAPDPTSWSYAPNRQLGGGFFNVEGGSYDSFRYTTTFGAAISRVDWHPDRQFGYLENGFFYKRYLSIYHNLETDLLRAKDSTKNTFVVSRDYLTIRIQPHRVISFDVSENYFRNIPTFDSRLIATGLLDKILFQGLSGGVRVELPYRLSLYSNLGQSHKSGDQRSSWNQMYGLAWGNIWRTGIRADVRYSKFDSSFGNGSYRSLIFSRELGERLRLDVQAGEQHLVSSFTNETRARWLTGTLDWFVGAHYFLGSGFTIYRGNTQSYNQWFLNLGYRF